ncbi:MAG TPA: glycosyltransferase [Polyangiaceae bacterium]|jgi:glycosyltransferase involved in cell wall biosynthesis|nr:glycosyltransferase [Polyangiaceae bacterium]
MPSPAERRLVLFLPTLGGGGAERVAVNLLAMFPDVERHLVLMAPRIAYPYDATLHVLHGDPVGEGSVRQRATMMARNTLGVGRLKRTLGPATWLSFGNWANVVNVATGRNGRVVVSAHSRESANIHGRTAGLLRRLVRMTYPRADLVVSVSDAVKRDLTSSFDVPPAKIRTIYNSVDLSAARAGASEPLSADVARLFANPVIVTAGALREPKGHWHLLRAFAKTQKLRSDVRPRLVLLGQGHLGPYLAGLSRELGLRTWTAWESHEPSAVADADVAFLGFQSNPFAFFARAALFAFPSLWEGFGNVILEAMACGSLVVAADCKSGPREIVAPGSRDDAAIDVPEYASAGVLMPVFDGERRPASTPLTATEELWATTLAKLLDDHAARSRYDEPARHRAHAFSTESLAPAWNAALFGDT